ncbi:MAG: hypothetical protein QOG98_3193, partial [Pseudonocardiales bacterium]|nr:hypothetical protein [Pseudonocardiales bacterium]
MTRTEPRSGLPRTDRPDAPAYLTRHQQRAAARTVPPTADDRDVPLYLRRFRERRDGAGELDAEPMPTWRGSDLGVSAEWAAVTRTKEIVPERREQLADTV